MILLITYKYQKSFFLFSMINEIFKRRTIKSLIERKQYKVKLFFCGALLDSVKPFTGQTCAFFSYSKAQNKKKRYSHKVWDCQSVISTIHKS